MSVVDAARRNREETNQFTNRGNKKLLQIIQYKKEKKTQPCAICRELSELEEKTKQPVQYMKEENPNLFEGLESYILLGAYCQMVVAGKTHLQWQRQKSLCLLRKYLNEDNVF